MSIKTPSFWYRKLDIAPAPLIEHLLAPLSALYRWGQRFDYAIKVTQRAEIPVLCVGNLNAGGSGKTPTALALAKLIKEQGLARTPYFLTRGYGGQECGPLLVDPKIHSAKEVGDEPLLLATHAPTIIAQNRVEGAKLAQDSGADLIIMDDGLQNPSLYKDLSFIVIDGEMGFGNEKTLPAGPLRMSLDEGFEHAQGFILIGEDKRNILERLPDGKPILRAGLLPLVTTIDKNAPYIAFAGLGYPQKFFTFLKERLGLNVIEERPYPDHYPYKLHELESLMQEAQNRAARLITTKKDALRLPHCDTPLLDIVDIELVWSDKDAVLTFLKSLKL